MKITKKNPRGAGRKEKIKAPKKYVNTLIPAKLESKFRENVAEFMKEAKRDWPQYFTAIFIIIAIFIACNVKKEEPKTYDIIKDNKHNIIA